jgi:uncharacterized membrane protein YhaH (DUF805 family)
MNNLLSDFMGFDGRINRQRWWIGVVVLIIAGLIIYWILGAILGTGFSMAALTDPVAMQAYVQKAAWVGLIGSVILSYPYLAITVKRRHDRDNNGYDAIGLIAVNIIWNILVALGLNLGGLQMIVSLIIGVYAIYILVVVGFLKGTPGPNQYGPDPLGG